jgi:hypothetical protein
MENDTQKAKVVGRFRSLITEHKTRPHFKYVRLTGNEKENCFRYIRDDKTCRRIEFQTKRPEKFPIGEFFRFRNKMTNYGWEVTHHVKSEGGRTLIALRIAERIVYTEIKRKR